MGKYWEAKYINIATTRGSRPKGKPKIVVRRSGNAPESIAALMVDELIAATSLSAEQLVALIRFIEASRPFEATVDDIDVMLARSFVAEYLSSGRVGLLNDKVKVVVGANVVRLEKKNEDEDCLQFNAELAIQLRDFLVAFRKHLDLQQQ